MKIVTLGCSFTYGEGLAEPWHQSWPAKLGAKVGATVYNLAHMPTSIDLYTDELLWALKNAKPDLVLIQGTMRYRQSFGLDGFAKTPQPALEAIATPNPNYFMTSNDHLRQRVASFHVGYTKDPEKLRTFYTYIQVHGTHFTFDQFKTFFELWAGHVADSTLSAQKRPYHHLIQWLGICEKAGIPAFYFPFNKNCFGLPLLDELDEVTLVDRDKVAPWSLIETLYKRHGKHVIEGDRVDEFGHFGEKTSEYIAEFLLEELRSRKYSI